MTQPLTLAELARCRKAWDTIANTYGTDAADAAALWAVEWAARLLVTAEPRFRQPWDSSHNATPGAREKGASHPGTLAPGNLFSTGEDDVGMGGRR